MATVYQSLLTLSCESSKLPPYIMKKGAKKKIGAGFYKGKKVLITGHTGFKGSWLSQILLNQGANIVGIALPPSAPTSLFNVLKIKSKIKNYFVDVRDIDKLRKIFKKEKPEIVFHLAAQPIVRLSYDEPMKTITTNTIGTTNILHLIKETPSVKSAVIITTDKVYENRETNYQYAEEDHLGGHDPYSASKAAADIIAHSYIRSFFNPKDHGVKHSTLVAIARAGNVIGGGDWAQYRIVPDIIRSIYEKNEPVEIRSPDAIRPWEHVLEPLSGYMLLGERLYNGEKKYSGAWNFGPYDEIFMEVSVLADEAVRILGKGTVNVKRDNTKHEATLLKLNINKAINELGWKPTLNFKQNLQYTFDWYKHYYEKQGDIVKFTNQQIDNFFK